MKGRDYKTTFFKNPTIHCLQETLFRSKNINRSKVRGWKKIYHENSEHNKVAVAILTSDKIDFE